MDKAAALEFLCRLGQAIALMLGSNCEVLVHEMRRTSLVTVAIFNGHISGRTVGSTLSIYGNDTTMDAEGDFDLQSDYLSQLVALPTGRSVKSTTVHMRGDNYHYALGINYDITVMTQMRHLLEGLTSAEGELYTALTGETQPGIETLFDACLEVLNKPVEQMKKAERTAMVRLLREKGAFQMQRSVPYVAERLGVSKYTVYNYLNELGDGT